MHLGLGFEIAERYIYCLVYLLIVLNFAILCFVDAAAVFYVVQSNS